MMRRFLGCTFLLTLLITPQAGASPAGRVVLDAQITAMLAAVSASDLRTINSGLLQFGTRNAFSEQSNDPKRGVFAARDWIRSQFETIASHSGGRMSVSLDEYTQPKTENTPRAVRISSVVATLRGDDPSGRTYVISSHYDSRNSDGNDPIKDAPGADDNGSGVACVIEAAKVMAATPFAGTIIFATYDGEEQGLFGSGHHAKTLHDAGVPVEATLNNDIIGASRGHEGPADPYSVRLFSEALAPDASIRRVNLIGSENDSPSRELARFVKSVAEAYVPRMHADLIYRSDRFLRGGDQQSFTDQGYPAVRFVEPHENYDHQHQDIRLENGIQYGDLQKYMDFDFLARVTRMNVAALASLALGPARPARVEMVNKSLGYDTTLRWNPVAGAIGYEIVWRATTASLWQHVRSVGNVTQFTVPVNKDEWIFAVRSVDAAGHRSPAVFPVPVRQ